MMKVSDLVAAVNELKKQNPVFDFTMYNILVDGKEIMGIQLQQEMFSFNLTTDSELTEMEQRADEEAEASRTDPEFLDPSEEEAA